MKKTVLLAAAFVALIATSCRKIEMDGGGSTVMAPPTTPGVQTIVLKGRIRICDNEIINKFQYDHHSEKYLKIKLIFITKML